MIDYDFDEWVADLIVHQERFIALVDVDEGPAQLWTSADGRSWREVVNSPDLELSHPAGDNRALASSGHGVLAVTLNGAIAISPNGTDWKPVEAPLGLDDFDIPSVFGGPDGWYLFAEIGDGRALGIFTSQDGEIWTRVGTDEG